MTAKNYLRDEMLMNPSGYEHPTSTGHSIYKRDKWMLKNSDVVFVNLLNSDVISIGCMFELAWADMLGKHVVVVCDGKKPYDHAFIKGAADVVFTSLDDALDYLEELAHCDL
jgi:nucleoside 2-deoxyribosyltransferase